LNIFSFRFRSSRINLIYSAAISTEDLISPPSPAYESFGVSSNRFPNKSLHKVVLKPISVFGCKPYDKGVSAPN